MDQGPVAKSATERAAEAIEAAEMMFAEEMGAALDLTPAAKAALTIKVAAAIQAAVAEERQKLACGLEMIGHVARRPSSGAMNGNTVSTHLFSNGARDLSLTMVAEEGEVAPVPIATGTPI